MQITLRRANALQASIQEVLKSIELSHTVAIDEFENVTETISQANNKVYEDNLRQRDLLHALYTIRGEVGKANAISGINDKLTSISFVSKRLEQLSVFATAQARTDFNVITAKLDKIRNAKESYYEKTVSTGVLNQAEIDGFKKDIQNLKKQKVALNDEVLALNVSTEITLDDTVVKILSKENLL